MQVGFVYFVKGALGPFVLPLLPSEAAVLFESKPATKPFSLEIFTREFRLLFHLLADTINAGQISKPGLISAVKLNPPTAGTTAVTPFVWLLINNEIISDIQDASVQSYVRILNPVLQDVVLVKPRPLIFMSCVCFSEFTPSEHNAVSHLKWIDHGTLKTQRQSAI